MIEHVAIRSFQSLRRVDLDLGRFTVIVGQSSSGKSALMRAFRAVASNISGTSAITRGADAAAITVRTGEAAVTLEYSRGAWRYRLVGPDGEKDYTKLNRSVPEAVTQTLRIAPVPTTGTSINFAGQFDRPYLLTESGATVARELGELTNVDTIYAAVREANRVRAAAAGTLKTRRADLERLVTEAARFADLKVRLAACDRAELAAARAAHLKDQIRRLTAATDALEIAEGVLARAEQLPPVPSETAALAAHGRLTTLHQLLRECASAAKAEAEAAQAKYRTSTATAVLEQQLHALLVEAGTCPTCQQPIRN